MNPSRFQRLKEIVQAALALPTHERDAYLRGACAEDCALLEEAQALLAADTRAFEPIETAGAARLFEARVVDDLRCSLAEAVPSRVGPYRIVETLGEGGMGAVYLAEQEEPIRRRVALKLVKLGMDTREVLARFEAERQALAMMDHPNVARVHDAGATETGRPYFVMEFVHGVPITRFCDEARLTMRERLTLFISVCHAIHHAHQKGIIHRDVKPSNVLVATVDAQPVPKVIDFGIAKATGQDQSNLTVFTALGQAIGTPEYMSPEQAAGATGGVDTTTDVYSLGVLLYELLTGTLPFNVEAARSAGWDSVVKTIREVEPPRPSTRVGAIGNGADEIAARRRIGVAALRRQLRGDLDWIVMKAMEKARALRYSSAAEFAADVERYLRDQPVLAGPPSTVYRLRKFARRYRTGLGIAAFVIAGLTTAAIESSRQRAAAVRARDESEAVTTFLSDMLGAVAPDQQGREISVREVLDAAEGKIGEKLEGRPLVQARLMNTMGNVYRKLALPHKARPLLEGSLALREKELGPNHLDVAQNLNDLGNVARVEGDLAGARVMYEKSLAIRERVLPPGHIDIARSLNNLGVVLQESGASQEAIRVYQRILPIQEKALGPDHADVGRTHNNIANALIALGDFRAALEHADHACRIKEATFGPEHIEVVRSLNVKAHILQRMKDYAASRSVLERIVPISERILGSDHTELAMYVGNLGAVLIDQKDFGAALPLVERALAIQEKGLGPDHPSVAAWLRNLGKLLVETGDYAAARKNLERGLAIDQTAYGVDSPEVASDLVELGYLDHKTGNDSAARIRLERAIEIREMALGPEHPEIVSSLEGFAAFLRDVGESARASALEERARAIQNKVQR